MEHGPDSSSHLVEKFLNLVPIEQDSYTSDIELLKQYQAYSAELLRLSLAGLGVIGFLVTSKLVTQSAVKICLIASIILFGMSAGGALGHRYLSSDGIHHLMKAIRLSKLKNPAEDQIKLQDCQMREKYRKSWNYLRLSCLSLGLGAIAIAAGFILATLL